ncbi:MAG: fatty acyl-AMP ligase [Xanthomonadaceae bacterium]|jgi:fatty-acyl-CoA synthase|nr:fatty acyl-AMP ligase [Xanthomonadaceae bacterium]
MPSGPTVTWNERLALSLGEFSTLTQGLDYAAQGETGVNFYSSLGRLEHSLTYRELRQRALRAGGQLRGLELRRGEHVALVAESSPGFLVLFYACQYAGLVPCLLPFSLFPGGKQAYIDQLANMMTSARVAAAFAPASVRDCVDAAAPSRTRTMSFEEVFSAPASGELQPARSDEMAYVQYSSGSTSQPKGVLISQSAVCANARAILQSGMKFREGDRSFSWLPFYHDMGLVGFVVSTMFSQCSVDYISPATFAKRPLLWMELMSANRGTVVYSPAFAYRLVARRLKLDDRYDLSAWRVAGIGGDMIRPDIIEEFCSVMQPHGFRRQAFMPSYGMAEMTLAISIADPDTPPATAAIGISSMASPPDVRRQYVACGKPLPSVMVEIVDTDGAPLPEGGVGRLRVRGPSMMSGYLDDGRVDAGAIADDGFFDTGDIGFLHQGQVVITGRAKDLILIRGRNLWPQDIEWALERVEPLTTGSVAAFAVDGEDADMLVVLAQYRAIEDSEACAGLRTRLATVLQQHFGIGGKIVFVPPRSLPFTSSGKLSRAKARALYLDGHYLENRAE